MDVTLIKRSMVYGTDGTVFYNQKHYMLLWLDVVSKDYYGWR